MRRPEGTCASCWQPHPPSQERCFGPPAASSPDEGGGTVHAVPPHGSANTPCCDRSPFDLPAADRITVNAAEVTCASADEGARQRPDTAALLVIADWLVRTLPGHRGAEQTAATLAYTARWIDAQPPVPPTPAPRAEPGSLVLGTEDRFHLWAKLYEIQQEAGLCRFGGRNYDPRLDHIYEEVTTALAYFEPPAPTDGEP